jgi:hypothetical protein
MDGQVIQFLNFKMDKYGSRQNTNTNLFTLTGQQL